MSVRPLNRSVLCAALVLLVCACWALGSEPGAFDRTLLVSGPVNLDVRSDPGGLHITTGSSTTSVRVHAVIKPLLGRVDFDLAEANIRALEKNPPIEQSGNRIRIGYVKDPALLRGVTIHFEIEAPRMTETQAYTESGGIRIDGIAGPAVATTASGRTEISNVASEIKVNGHSGAIVVRNAGGNVFARNQSGGIQLSGIRGAVEAETTSGRTEVSDVSGEIRTTTHSGSINIDKASGAVVAHNSSGSIQAFQLGGSVRAETKSGAIRISQVSPAPIRALAESGAIQVTLASGGGYLIDAQSVSGKVSGPLANMSGRTIGPHSLKAQIGSGGPLVDLDTHSSKIDIN
jgi:hypothetical protein